MWYKNMKIKINEKPWIMQSACVYKKEKSEKEKSENAVNSHTKKVNYSSELCLVARSSKS